jgi:hypothetical protein
MIRHGKSSAGHIRDTSSDVPIDRRSMGAMSDKRTVNVSHSQLAIVIAIVCCGISLVTLIIEQKKLVLKLYCLILPALHKSAAAVV